MATAIFSFAENADWRSKVTAVLVNNYSTSHIVASAAGSMTVDISNMALSPGTHIFRLKASGYEDATIIVTIPELPLLPSPTITSYITDKGKFTLNFADNADWRDKLTEVYINGVRWDGTHFDKTVAGQVKIKLQYNPGTHTIVLKATGYADVTVTAIIPEPPQSPTITSYEIDKGKFTFNFADNADWRDKLTEVYINGVRWDGTHFD
ncbi:hemoblobin-interacting domain-containing protein, partial [Solibacillus silvestris]|uniref:hemoblobin-interacting domain-containing protein n=1 Tax=Solibacillus silvestris TaxID=76853 RepID=UPI003F80C492